MMDYLSQERLQYQQVDEKSFLIHRSSSMLWEMIVSNIMCRKTEYIKLKHAK
ncbi:hypothetical protein LDENG_00241680 [Lucifuga dentata]|nr:hypothetical protein LDENG_00241680 [Lucifuga dentata]